MEWVEGVLAGRVVGGAPRLPSQSTTECGASNARCLGLALSLVYCPCLPVALHVPPNACVRLLDSISACRVLGSSSPVR